MRHRPAQRPPQQRGCRQRRMPRRHEPHDLADVGRSAAGSEKARRVPGGAAVPAQVHGIRRNPLGSQGPHHRSLQARHLKIEIRPAAPRAAMHQNQRRARCGGHAGPHRERMAVGNHGETGGFGLGADGGHQRQPGDQARESDAPDHLNRRLTCRARAGGRWRPRARAPRPPCDPPPHRAWRGGGTPADRWNPSSFPRPASAQPRTPAGRRPGR